MVFEGIGLQDSTCMGMDLHEIFNSIAKFNIKYWYTLNSLY